MPLPEVKICVDLSCLTNAAQFYQQMEPIPNALDSLNAMGKKGCTVALVYVWTSSHAKFNAREWLHQWFGVTWEMRLITMLQPMQSFLYTDVLIDRHAPRPKGSRPIDYFSYLCYGSRPDNVSGFWFDDWSKWHGVLLLCLHLLSFPAEQPVPLLD